MPNHATNIILGTDEGKFTVTFRNPKHVFVKKSFAAENPESVLDYCRKLAKRYDILHVLTSSSMDFPEEEKVTRKQVEKLYEKLGCEN